MSFGFHRISNPDTDTRVYSKTGSENGAFEMERHLQTIHFQNSSFDHGSGLGSSGWPCRWSLRHRHLFSPFFQAQMDAERAFGEQQEREHPHRFGGLKFGIGTVLRGFTIVGWGGFAVSIFIQCSPTKIGVK